MKIKIKNNSNIPLRFVFYKENKKYINSVKLKKEENCVLTIDELQKAPKIVRFVFHYLSRMSYANKKDDNAYLIVNENIVKANITCISEFHKGIIIIDDKLDLFSNKNDVLISDLTISERKNDNYSFSIIKSVLIILFLVLSFCGIIFLAYFLVKLIGK